MSKPLILVTGNNGQLGNELRVLSKEYSQFDWVLTDVAELDITNAKKVEEFFRQYKPVVCINAAAYTAVDKAETDRELALKINGEAVGYLADNCAALNTIFIHISTDYVFDGTATIPYEENYPVNPVNYYGESKLRGEQIAIEHYPSVIILRTSWVYSYFGNNFVKTMLRLMKERESISVIYDQLGSPTYAGDLAEAIMQIVTANNPQAGIYNFSNDGVISWFDFAMAIKQFADLQCEIKPIETSGYPTPAKRPGYSVLNKEKIQATFGIKLKDWKDSLQRCISLLQP